MWFRCNHEIQCPIVNRSNCPQLALLKEFLAVSPLSLTIRNRSLETIILPIWDRKVGPPLMLEMKSRWSLSSHKGILNLRNYHMTSRPDAPKSICLPDWKFLQDENYARDVDIVNNNVQFRTWNMRRAWKSRYFSQPWSQFLITGIDDLRQRFSFVKKDKEREWSLNLPGIITSSSRKCSCKEFLALFDFMNKSSSGTIDLVRLYKIQHTWHKIK